LPIVLQDEPVTTQVNMPAPFIAQVCAEITQIQAVKLEESPTLPKITRLRALFGDRVAIFGGLGGVYFFEELSRGADGAMTGFPYPEALRAIREHFLAGRRDEARALFYRWLPLIRYESQPGATPGHRGGHPQGDPPPPRLDRLRAGAAARARARRAHADRARRAARRRHVLSTEHRVIALDNRSTGTEDPLVPPISSRDLHERIPGSELLTMENAGHLHFIEQSECFTATNLEFFTKHRGA
jgi:pimeloyl-ACP methyl ester carboxylesterase